MENSGEEDKWWKEQHYDLQKIDTSRLLRMFAAAEDAHQYRDSDRIRSVLLYRYNSIGDHSFDPRFVVPSASYYFVLLDCKGEDYIEHFMFRSESNFKDTQKEQYFMGYAKIVITSCTYNIEMISVPQKVKNQDFHKSLIIKEIESLMTQIAIKDASFVREFN